MIRAADLFCGAGGTSTGLALACREASRKVDLLAVNHWGPAVETHKANHPWARHLCETLDSVDPRKVIPGGRLDILAASPECTHHSVARGGKPMNDQSRATAWHVLRWCEALRVAGVLVENVPEFQTWGPLGTNGKPLKSRRGETFKAWLDALISLGFAVEYRVLNAADYGDATTRRRLFVLATRRRGGINWPKPTHAKNPGIPGMLPLSKWRAAKEIIDPTLPSQSIFNRKRPLSPKTLARIEHGLRKFGGPAAEPFIVMLRGGGCKGAGGVRSLEDPAATISAGGTHHALVQPFILVNRNNNVPTGMDEPIKPLCAGGQHMAYVEPFITTIAHGGHDCRARSLNEPMPTQSAHNQFALVEPFIMKQHFGRDCQSVDQPLPTIVGKDHTCLVEAFFVPRHGERPRQDPRTHSVNEPAPTLACTNSPMLCEPVSNGCVYDIRLRMLQPHELAGAMGFPKDYKFIGTKTDAVRMIGNAVCVNQARVLFRSLLAS